MLPDEVVCIDELPHTATGKIMKIRLREIFCQPELRGNDPTGHGCPARSQSVCEPRATAQPAWSRRAGRIFATHRDSVNLICGCASVCGG
jgi:hypothetical protein